MDYAKKFKKMKPIIYILLVFAVIIIGDDETRHFLKRTVKRLLKRENKEVC